MRTQQGTEPWLQQRMWFGNRSRGRFRRVELCVAAAMALLSASCMPQDDAVEQQASPMGCDPRLHTATLSEIADPLGCMASAGDVQRAGEECDDREGHTEFRHISLAYICYSVTVADDGWRMCDISEPLLAVRVSELAESSTYACGNTAPRADSAEKRQAEVDLANKWGSDLQILKMRRKRLSMLFSSQPRHCWQSM